VLRSANRQDGEAPDPLGALAVPRLVGDRNNSGPRSMVDLDVVLANPALVEHAPVEELSAVLERCDLLLQG
jgi:hypothetical protein